MRHRLGYSIVCVALLACGRAEPPKEASSDTASPSSPESPAAARPELASAPASDTPIPIRDFAARVGVTQSARDTTLCLTIANDALPVGTPLFLISAKRPQNLSHARVGARRSSPCTRAGDEWGSVDMERAAFYQVEVTGDLLGSDVTIAVVGPVSPFSVRGDVIVGDLDGDGREEMFEECTSNEGIHLSIVTPGVSIGSQRWHQYFYVPYNLEPSCPDVAPPN